MNEQEILNDLETMIAREVAVKHGVTVDKAYRIWHKHNPHRKLRYSRLGKERTFDTYGKPELRKLIIADRLSKMTYREIAKRRDVTFQRVQDICKEEGITLDMRKYRWLKKPIDIT